jgi:hypothetical protein
VESDGGRLRRPARSEKGEGMSDDFRDHLFEYRFDDSWWGITIRARSEAEAKQRLSALTWAQYRGEVFATIPVPGWRLLELAKRAYSALRAARKVRGL